MKSSAEISSCGLYRYSLHRHWSDGPYVAFVMLNPSVADAQQDDPTIRRCVGFARAWGFGGVRVYNLFALRATKPKDMLTHAAPVGPHNDAHLLCAAGADKVIAAWGTHGGHRNRDVAVMDLLADAGVIMEALAVTKDGHPQHPLFVKLDAEPRLYRGRR